MTAVRQGLMAEEESRDPYLFSAGLYSEFTKNVLLSQRLPQSKGSGEANYELQLSPLPRVVSGCTSALGSGTAHRTPQSQGAQNRVSAGLSYPCLVTQAYSCCETSADGRAF